MNSETKFNQSDGKTAERIIRVDSSRNSPQFDSTNVRRGRIPAEERIRARRKRARREEMLNEADKIEVCPFQSNSIENDRPSNNKQHIFGTC
jgi:hypothetical protein